MHALLQSEKKGGILHSIRSFLLFHLKPVNSQGDRTPLQTACKISLAAPFEKCSLLISPVFCHSSLWVVVCKMERHRDLVLLIKASMLIVCSAPTPKYYCVFMVRWITLLKETLRYEKFYTRKFKLAKKQQQKNCITRISNTYRRNHWVLTKHLGSVEANAQHMLSASFFRCTKCCSILLLYNTEPDETQPASQVY